tara:strand:+ start:31750 stop:34452 length:2703 start_codon:yes stop_codon:yes gene_type:complete
MKYFCRPEHYTRRTLGLHFDRRRTDGKLLSLRWLLAWIVLVVPTLAIVAEGSDNQQLDDSVSEFLTSHCVDCHSEGSAEAEIVLDAGAIDWSDPRSSEVWTKVHQALTANEMPPSDVDHRPSDAQRNVMLHWLDKTLTQRVPPGGSVLRRLNRQEYENSVRSVLGIPFDVPNSFPADTQSHGFDNIGEGLVLSPPLMQQYVQLATAAADELLPPEQNTVKLSPTRNEIGPGDFSLNFTTGHEIDGVLRMVSGSEPLSRGCVWPNRFEAQVSGEYDVAINLSAYRPTEGHVPVVHLLARKTTGSNFAKAFSLRKLAEFELESEQASMFQTSVELLSGETIVVHYDNAPIYCDITGNKPAYLERFSAQLLDTFRDEPELGLAWMKAGHQRSDRGWSWWKRIEAERESAKRNLDQFDPESEEVQAFALAIARQEVNTEETLCCFHFFKGPGIDIHKMSITGPTRLIEDEETRRRKQRTARFLGRRGDLDDAAYTAQILRPMLDRAFRRPVTDAQLSKYVGIATNHIADGASFRDGIHLSIRAALCSTHFLYRGQRPGKMDDYDLATRLSYFLTSGPPDDTLRKLAMQGQLSAKPILQQQTRRLLKQSKVKNFLSSFTGQWLDLRLLPQIMPDARLLRWTDKDLAAVTAETEMFVSEILHKNHRLETFIDADFTYLNRRNAKLYEIDFPKSDQMKRVTLPRESLRGGILTQASVLMATANGVDTQPVLRGAWMLENIFGMPTAPPPADVPAIEPDTTGAKSIRELLDRHKADASCARCHERIDPPGFVLESFDPVGRYREYYPIYKKRGDKVVTLKGQPIDCASVMPDGTTLKDITDLKRHLIKNPDIFSRCLTEKLLVYATGRAMNYGDHKVIDRIVDDTKKRGNGFADLIVEVVQSDSFGTK